MPQRTVLIGLGGTVLLAAGAAAGLAQARPGGPPDLGGVVRVTPPQRAVAPSRTAAPDAVRAVTPPSPPGVGAADDPRDADDEPGDDADDG
ncbi:hypothetical protein [Actinomadura yumaensis]|uniref:Uncharacterized protein n=1 Tax=Actinomadura yumaensis TaxID=111807 RepID=A0ABW2CN16_9ACTN